MTAPLATRIARLSEVSARQVVDPDQAIPGAFGDGQVLPDELLSTAGLDLELTAAQRAALSREEVAAIAQEGVRFEAILGSGFLLHISKATDFSDPRIIYALHEVGEETRHSRLFVRAVGQLDPKAANPLEGGVLGAVKHWMVRTILGHQALMYVLVLAGEEIPDLIQKLAAEHPGTDPFLRQVSHYHRQEEARHLAFARMVLPELWAKASWCERARVRHQAPWIIEYMFDSLVHPGVYAAAGLPAWRTWWAVKSSASRRALRHQATRPVLVALIEAGVLKRGRVPFAWRRLTGTGRAGPAAAQKRGEAGKLPA